MTNKTFYYARVSSKGQNLDRQIEKFKELGADDRDIITEKESGKDTENRSAYKALRDQMLRSGDTLVVVSLDRLGRNKAQIKDELQHYKENNIRVKVLDIPTTLIDFPEGQEWVMEMVNNILIEVLGSIAEQERETIRKRQREGIEAAKKKGVVKFGRPQAEKPENWKEVYKSWKKGEITAVKAMELTGLTKTTFYKLAKTEKR
ncbi:MAG: recombinase family protein [Ruminococcus sp.]|nr:recombinase family protein [Ruminococcus sp.]